MSKYVKDFSDFLDAGGTAAELIALADAAPTWKPESEDVMPASSNGHDADMEAEDPNAELVPIGAEIGLSELAELRPVVVENMLRTTETMGLVSASKAGKTYFAISLAMCVSMGRKFLDTFATAKGKILYIDCELHPETFWRRVAAIASAMGIMRDAIYPNFELLNLRGRNTNLIRLGSLFQRIKPGQYNLIIIDPLYRLMPPDTDENSNADMTYLWNIIDQYAAMTQTAIVVIHHASKGSQVEKSVTDIGAGAGAQSRAADTWVVLRPHEADDAAVLDAAIRSFKPIEPLCIRWQYPVWTAAPELDPENLRMPGRRKRKPEGEPTPEQPKAEPWTAERFASQFIAAEGQIESTILIATGEAGLSDRKAKMLLDSAIDRGIVHRWKYASRATPHRFSSLPQKRNKGEK